MYTSLMTRERPRKTVTAPGGPRYHLQYPLQLKRKEDAGGGALLEVTRKSTLNKGKAVMQI